MDVKTQRHFDTVLPMALATLLIVNSHLEAFYPRSWMAADGLLGNDLFFLLSGLRMAGSRGLNQGFMAFLKSRVLRIYPVVWIAALTVWIMAGYPATLSQAINVFLWPTDFTYVELILPFYVIYYGIHRARNPLPVLKIGVALAVCWILAVVVIRSPMRAFSDVPVVVHVIDYFCVFLLGVAFQTEARARQIRSPFYLWIFGLLIYFSVKLAVFKMAWLNLYWLVHLLAALAACGTFLFLGRWDWRTQYWWPKRGVEFLALHSLEIYVIHSTLIRTTSLHQFVFPLNIVLLVLITFILAWGLRKLMDRLSLTLSPK